MQVKDFEDELEAYKKFRDEKLIPERGRLRNDYEKLEDEIKNYESLVSKCEEFEGPAAASSLKDPQAPLKIPLDLGCGYSVDFEVFDREFVLVCVGFGFYAQMTWKEASIYSKRRLEMLKKRLDRLDTKLNKIEEHLQITNECISALSK